MRVRRTPSSNCVFALPGGTEDNDAWVTIGTDDQGADVIRLTFELEPADRHRISRGDNIELIIWGRGMPPVAMQTTDEELGRGARAD